VSQPELLKLVARRLEAAGIDFMVTGRDHPQGRLPGARRIRAEAHPIE
jgi:hypothetical protein